jgi:hypothetical protein
MKNSSLISISKDRIVGEMLNFVKRQSNDIEKGASCSNGTVLVLDYHTIKIVSSACKRTDLSDNGVLFIEQLEKPRQPFPDLDVLYFVSCNKSAVEEIIKDHKSALYKYSHVFFCSGRLTDSMMDQFTSNKDFVSRCRNLVEMNLDYIAFEPKVFTTDMPLAIKSIGTNDDHLVKTHIDSMTSLLASLKEKPVMRYMAPETSAANSMVSQRIALGLRRELDELCRTLPKSSQLQANGTTLLVLDRSVETAGLWIHDFFYQALALDILDGVDEAGIKWSLGVYSAGSVADDGSTEQAMSVVPSFEYKTKTGKGAEEVRKVILTETDPIYVKHRHDHFAYALDQIRNDLRSLIEKNEAARRAMGDKSGSSGVDPLDILRSIPEYQDLVAKLSVHIKLSESLASAIEKLALKEVVKFEQELATGVDDDGKEISIPKLFTSLTHLFTDSNMINPEERLRLVALYLSQVDGVSPELAKELITSIGKLEGEFATSIENFLALRLDGTAPIQPDGVMSNGPVKVSPSVQAARHSLKNLSRITSLGKSSKIKKNKTLAKNSKFVNCRFRSELADIVESVLQNSLDTTAFPIVGGTGTSHYMTAISGGPKSPETTSAAAMWGQSAHAGNESGRQKIVVFVVGGITLGECREMAEIETKYDVDVFIGGSTILTPRRLVEILLRP